MPRTIAYRTVHPSRKDAIAITEPRLAQTKPVIIWYYQSSATNSTTRTTSSTTYSSSKIKLHSSLTLKKSSIPHITWIAAYLYAVPLLDFGGKKGSHHPYSYLGYGAVHFSGFSNFNSTGLEANASSTDSASNWSCKTLSSLNFMKLASKESKLKNTKSSVLQAYYIS